MYSLASELEYIYLTLITITNAQTKDDKIDAFYLHNYGNITTGDKYAY